MSKNKNKKKTKLRFEVEKNETIDDCLNRIKKQGYIPIRRLEEPIFQEVNKDGQVSVEPISRKITFEAIPTLENER